MTKQPNNNITPLTVEKRLMHLSKELDECQESLLEAEVSYYQTKAKTEIALAKARLGAKDFKRVQEIEDNAIVLCQDLITELAIVEARVRALRANANRIKTQVDIARSIGTSVRASMEIL